MFLSFIVPVYNVEKYLAECLDSLLDQDISHEEYEIICVNDGSTDGSLDILRQYEEKYANIRVIDKENGGVSAARNDGIKAALGDYIWMVDSDDLIAHHILAWLYETSRSHNPDIIDFGAYSFHEKLTDEESAAYRDRCLPATSFANNVYITRSLFKRAFLHDNHIQFDTEIAYSEDSLFKCTSLLCKPSVLSYGKMVYLVRYRSGSAITLVSASAVKKKIKSYHTASLRFRKYYSEAEGELRGQIADLLMSNLWQALSILAKMPIAEAVPYLKALHADGLFPFIRPEECGLCRSYQTARTDIAGKIFDKVYIHMHRPWGFAAMVLLQKLIRAKKKLVK